jgi:hypothetical protein
MYHRNGLGVMVFNTTFNNISVNIVAVSFLFGGGNQKKHRHAASN